MKRIAFTTLGCKANWSDSEAVIQALGRAGFRVVPFDSDADAYVVNTCAVTSYAGAQSRQMIRRARRRSPGALVVAAGCLGEVSRDSLAMVEGVDAIFGAGEGDSLVSYLCERLGMGYDDSLLRMSAVGPLPSSAQSRARAFVKIQEGCDRRCAYCIVPKARGACRSMPPGEVVSALRGLSAFHREIVLAGIDIGQYGKDLGGSTDLKALLRQVQSERGISRLRISTLGPALVDDEMIGIMGAGGICRHVHLSIQSGSDGVLERMRRGYCASDVGRAARALADSIPGIAITGDVIAGFPGESEVEHLETVNLLGGLPLAGLHVFPFSRREGTLAARMEDQLPKDVIRRRAQELRGVAQRLRNSYLEGAVGKSFDVIVTSREGDSESMVEAVADTAVKLRLPHGRVPYGEMGRARVVDVVGTQARGEWE